MGYPEAPPMAARPARTTPKDSPAPAHAPPRLVLAAKKVTFGPSLAGHEPPSVDIDEH